MLWLLCLSPILCLAFTGCDQRSPSPFYSLSCAPLPPFILPMSQILLKTDECLHPGNMPVVLGGNFPQHSRHTVYICHFLFSPPFEGSRGGGFMLENFTCTPQIFIPSSVTSHLQNEKVILNTIVFSF